MNFTTITPNMDVPNTPGVLKVEHRDSGQFYLSLKQDLGTGYNNFYTQAKLGKSDNPELLELIHACDVDRDLVFSYCETESKDQARKLRHAIVKEHFGDGKVLNRQDMPIIIAAYKLTHTSTGKFFAGQTTNLIKRIAHIQVLLKTGQFKTPEFQALYDQSGGLDAFQWTWVFCKESEETARYVQEFLNDPRCCNHHRRKHRAVYDGVYILEHKQTGHYYIGSSDKVSSRISSHKWMLKNNRHSNQMLQAVFNKHGDYFNIHVTPCDSREAAYVLEQAKLDAAKNDTFCCNFSMNARSSITEVLKVDSHRLRQHKGIKESASKEERREALSIRMKEHWARRPKEREGALNPFARTIEVDGKVYGSIADASKFLNVCYSTVQKRLKSEAFPTYRYLDEREKTQDRVDYDRKRGVVSNP